MGYMLWAEKYGLDKEFWSKCNCELAETVWRQMDKHFSTNIMFHSLLLPWKLKTSGPSHRNQTPPSEIAHNRTRGGKPQQIHCSLLAEIKGRNPHQISQNPQHWSPTDPPEVESRNQPHPKPGDPSRRCWSWWRLSPWWSPSSPPSRFLGNLFSTQRPNCKEEGKNSQNGCLRSKNGFKIPLCLSLSILL